MPGGDGFRLAFPPAATPVNDAPHLEREAAIMGARAATIGRGADGMEGAKLDQADPRSGTGSRLPAQPEQALLNHHRAPAEFGDDCLMSKAIAYSTFLLDYRPGPGALGTLTTLVARLAVHVGEFRASATKIRWSLSRDCCGIGTSADPIMSRFSAAPRPVTRSWE